MAVSSGLSRALLGIGQGYMNARSQGRRERQNLITTNARLKSDRQRNAIEMAKLTSLDDDRADRRKSDAAAARLKQEEFRQRTLGDVGLEMDRGMKRLEGRTGAELDTGIHQLRGNIMNLFGATPDRPYGITQDQLDRSLAAPGSVIPGVFERKIGAGNLVNPDYGSDPTTQFYDPQSIQEIYGEDTPQVGQSMATRPEGSRNFLEFANTPIDDQTKDLMGMMGQGAAKYLGGQMRMPQDFGDMMSMQPGGTFRSPEEIQKAVKSGIPDSVMISREREATPKDVPVRASYGMKETDKDNIESRKAAAAKSTASIQVMESKLGPEIALMEARTRKALTDVKFAPLKASAQLASQALGRARLAFAQIKEDNLNKRHSDMMGFRAENLENTKGDQRALNVRSIFTATGDLQKSIVMASQEKARIMSNPNVDVNSPATKAAIQEIDSHVSGLQRQIGEMNRWGVAETGSPMEWANLGIIGNDMANTGFLTDNPLMAAMGHAMQSNPAMFGTMGSRRGYESDRAAGLYQAPTEETMYRMNNNFGGFFGGRSPDSGGMGGAMGGGGNQRPQPNPSPQPKPKPKPEPKNPPAKKPTNMSRDELFDSIFGKNAK